MKRYPIPAGLHRVETTVAHSRFIATAGPVASVDEAHEFIARLRGEFADATHNAYAYRVGFGDSVTDSCSDDGEPPGTAGRPMLEVLRNSGLGDVIVVVTRYFGGTKLGTGGLVRAYSGAVQAVLTTLPRTERVDRHTFTLMMPYKFYDTLTRLVAAHEGQVHEAQFAAEVTLRFTLPVDRVEEFNAALRQVSAGHLQVQAGD